VTDIAFVFVVTAASSSPGAATSIRIIPVPQGI
jgi:hypothetical protein